MRDGTFGVKPADCGVMVARRIKTGGLEALDEGSRRVYRRDSLRDLVNIDDSSLSIFMSYHAR
jgi:hypothetical protein